MKEYLLLCPYCEHLLHVDKSTSDERFGIVSCECDEYPIVQSIFYIKKSDNLINRRVVDLIKENKFNKATWTLLSQYSFRHSISTYFFLLLKEKLNITIPLTVVLRLYSTLGPSRSWFIYLLNRKLDTSMQVINQFVTKLKNNSTVVDVGIGTGSFFRQLSKVKKTKMKSYIGVDISFFSLALASLYSKTPKTILICSDVDYGLPINKNMSDLIIIQDTFCQIKKKIDFINSCAKTLSKNSPIIFIGNLFESNRSTRFWGYGIKKENFAKYLSRKFKDITFIDPYKKTTTAIDKKHVFPNAYALIANKK